MIHTNDKLVYGSIPRQGSLGPNNYQIATDSTNFNESLSPQLFKVVFIITPPNDIKQLLYGYYLTNNGTSKTVIEWGGEGSVTDTPKPL